MKTNSHCVETGMLERITQSLDMHVQALTLRAQRAELLAANIANADTPNYKARDMDFQSLYRARLGLAKAAGALHTTHSSHLPGTASARGEAMYRVPMQSSLDGNTVESHVEQAAFAENALRYQASLRFLDGSIKSLIRVIRGE